jgi:hypothetical protein
MNLVQAFSSWAVSYPNIVRRWARASSFYIAGVGRMRFRVVVLHQDLM